MFFHTILTFLNFSDPKKRRAEAFKAELARKRAEEDAERENAELHRKLEKKIELEKRKTRILEQRRKMREQSARAAAAKRRKLTGEPEPAAEKTPQDVSYHRCFPMSFL